MRSRQLTRQPPRHWRIAEQRTVMPTEVIPLPVVARRPNTSIRSCWSYLSRKPRKKSHQSIAICRPGPKTPDDMETLITVRRSFHTLKGSGRMVGAERIGEYCWTVENLLND